MAQVEIKLPLELDKVEINCMICLEEMSFPVFCRQCKQGTCFDCLVLWFGQSAKQECPKCRLQTSIGTVALERKTQYSCPREGHLVRYFCQQCDECLCRECYTAGEGPHGRHAKQALDDLRREIFDGIGRIRAVIGGGDGDDLSRLLSTACSFTPGGCQKALSTIAGLLPCGNPQEMVRQRRAVLAEIEKVAPVKTVPKLTQGKNPAYILPNEKFFEYRCQVKSPSATFQSYSAEDLHGNRWEMTVYPQGFSDGHGRSVSVYLTLAAGQPGRYEYSYVMYEGSGLKPLAEYLAVDDFVVGSKSQGCQRLVQIDQAKRYGVDKSGGYQLAFGVRQTDGGYGPKCATGLIANKNKNLPFKSFLYTVRDYPAQRNADRILFSNLMYDHQNMAWRLRVDCNGHQEKGQFCSAYLVLLNGAEGWFDIFIKLVHPTIPELSIKRELTHYFTVHSSWGVPHFIDQMQINDFMIGPNQLKFEYGMRPARFNQER
uniref:E3 ubiquitin-protein ligase TRIM37 n=1 Tax=Culex pipiens TaxID=7175 RepID=A0A8D8KAS7_CULPI